MCGVRNGTFATITAMDVDQRDMIIRAPVRTPSTNSRPGISTPATSPHASATTIHKARGITVDQALV